MLHSLVQPFVRLTGMLVTAGVLLTGTPATAQPLPMVFAFAEAQLEGQLNINTATQPQWELLPGIGPSTAAKIVEYRSKHPFADATQLMRVKGVGRKTFDRVKPFLSTKGETTLRAVGKGGQAGSKPGGKTQPQSNAR